MTTAVKVGATRGLRAPDPNWMDTASLDDLVRQSEEYCAQLRDFYDSRARWNRHFYRFSGILVIVLGGSLPIIAGADFPGKDLTIAVIGFVVATITALRGFYRWDAAWVLMRETEFAITKRYVAWKAVQMAAPDPEALRQATIGLLSDMVAVRENEARAFFKDLPIPPGNNQAKAEE